MQIWILHHVIDLGLDPLNYFSEIVWGSILIFLLFKLIHLEVMNSFSLVEDGQILGWKQRTKESNLESFAVGNEG